MPELLYFFFYLVSVQAYYQGPSSKFFNSLNTLCVSTTENARLNKSFRVISFQTVALRTTLLPNIP
jgi:hypothetical protein